MIEHSDDELFSIQRQTLESEPSRWLNERAIGQDMDILQYWKSKQFEYPVLSQIAGNHLAILATSAASERVFSTGGDIITKKRNRLAPDTLRYLLCLRSWNVIAKEEINEMIGKYQETEN